MGEMTWMVKLGLTGGIIRGEGFILIRKWAEMCGLRELCLEWAREV